MKKNGFTLIELMIVVAIIGILSMFALPAYQDYTKRTYVSEGMALSTSAKLAVTEYYATQGAWPSNNADAGLPAGDKITGQAVSGIWVTNGPDVDNGYPGGITVNFAQLAAITIFFNQKVVSNPTAVPTTQPTTFPTGNNLLVLGPLAPMGSINDRAGSVQWICVAHSTDVQDKWLPANCRSQIVEEI